MAGDDGAEVRLDRFGPFGEPGEAVGSRIGVARFEGRIVESEGTLGVQVAGARPQNARPLAPSARFLQVAQRGTRYGAAPS
jgi:hypothetical protein